MALVWICQTIRHLGREVQSASPADPEAAASKRIDHLQREYQKYIRDTIETRKTGCTSKNILRRREWGSLSQKDRRSYIDAVYCLHNNHTTITPTTDIPGVRNRYDDFVGAHLLLTPVVHLDGLFLPFHRFYLQLYETALRTECGYTGAHPYWDWTLSYTDPRQSTMFDGSPWSMGSNGAFAGPFAADTTFRVNLGPVAFEPVGPDGGFGYNPRCLTRDLSLEAASNTRPTNVSALLEGCADLACLNVRMDDPKGGVHGSGHIQVGGIALDRYVDRLWTIWQNLGDPQDRTYQVWGTQTAWNMPPSDNVTLDTPVPFGSLSDPKPIRELVSTIDGPFCYIYE
ncbi:hypothetical protein C8A00DRAFT_46195 [Chaetomidium leptoderma]|uniref:Tyrosinase copper-binding domain-containing protein n=1 Tax=Chaetomidium leptoderma TaxID=669021 RepID=A0AAN6ZUC1_9PEZI|nr:hypothetical protein C8A00DRAFT_46195 [Chaetomidium leptoderma]